MRTQHRSGSVESVALGPIVCELEVAGSCHSSGPPAPTALMGSKYVELGSPEDPASYMHCQGDQGLQMERSNREQPLQQGPLQCIPYLNMNLRMIYDKIQPIYLH